MTGEMLKIATFTSLYPNQVQSRHGLFVEHRLRHLLATGEVESRVIAPVPWFPFRGERFGKYGAFARVPPVEDRHGIRVVHPRYPLVPKVGMSLAPLLMALAARPSFRRLLDGGYGFRAIDAHYFYPDGVAAAFVGRWLEKPVVITARGTDINLIPEHRIPRRQILWAAGQCSAMITVCQALKDRLVALGASADRISVLRNGVDLGLFRPVNRSEARKRLGLAGPTLVSVGFLVERKGHHIAIEALPDLPGVTLVVVGEGAWESRLRDLAIALGVADRVRFAGSVPQEALRDYYSAADALVLASDREGMANVLLESLACGNPVIANPSWGTPEVIADPDAGILMARRDAPSLVDAYHELMRNYPDRDAVRRYATRFGWDSTTRGQLELFSGI